MEKMKRKLMATSNIVKNIKNFPIWFGDYFGPKDENNSKTIIYNFRNGLKFKTRRKTIDSAILHDVAIRKVYFDFFSVKEWDIVVDIGAHIGTFSVSCAFLNKNGKIYSFEPHPWNYKLLKENIELNNIKNIISFNKCMAGKTELKNFYITKSLVEGTQGGGNFYTKKGEEIKVDAISLADFIMENKINKIDFLKMDCEGGEYEILYNCDSETMNKIKKIALEYHDHLTSDKGIHLKEFLKKHGFKIIKIPSSNIIGMLYAWKEDLK